MRRGYLDRTGEVQYAVDLGQPMKIVAYYHCNDIDVLLNDDTLIKGMRYSQFSKGKVPYSYGKGKLIKESRLGEERVNKAGRKMWIVAYRDSMDIDIKFDDGTVCRGRTYANFCNGRITCPSDKV